MHRLLSSAGLWPTLVSILALFVHPLLFCLFSFLLHLLLLLPVDRCLSIYLFWRWEDFWDCVHTLFTGSSCLPVPPPLLPGVFSLSVSSPFHLALLITPPPPLTRPFLLTACFNMTVSFLVSSTLSRAVMACWDDSAYLFRSFNQKPQTSEKCHFVLFHP